MGGGTFLSRQLKTNEDNGELPDVQEMTVDGVTLYQALQAGSAVLQANVNEVNALNVFPVPDGDTGTNMSLTLRAALDEAKDIDQAPAYEILRRVSHGALMGARGNSGVILSQILRGVARGLDEKATISAADIAAALREGADTAYKGVMKPVEGTMLTVIRDTATVAERAANLSDAQAAMKTVFQEAQASLARTPQLLPVLAEAGVVDAGGQGLLCIFEGILAFASGETLVEHWSEQHTAGALEVNPHAHPPEEEQYGFDVQCIIQGEALDVDALRDHVAGMGDSVLVVGDAEAVKVHVHTDHPGEVLEYAIQQGDVSSIIIENMQLQYQEFLRAAQAAQAAAPADVLPSDRVASYLGRSETVSDISVVSVVSGEGLSRVFESLGIDAIVSGGQTMNPSTQDLVAAIEEAPGDKIIILPNNSNIILTAEQAQAMAEKTVLVVPSKTVPQGISAVLAFDQGATLDENYAAMLSAIQQIVTMEITQAVRTVQVNGLTVQKGQFIGLLNGDLKIADDDLSTVAKGLIGSLLVDEYEIMTIYCGQDISLAQGQALADEFQELYPDLEFEVIDGGQPHYHYIISAE